MDTRFDSQVTPFDVTISGQNSERGKTVLARSDDDDDDDDEERAMNGAAYTIQ